MERRTDRKRMVLRMERRVESEPVEGLKRERMSSRNRDQPEDVSRRGMFAPNFLPCRDYIVLYPG